MEAVVQWLKMRFSFKKATIIICFFNLITIIFLIHTFFSPPSSHSVQLKSIKESEEIRRTMEPLELIKRVSEIERESYIEPESIQQRDAKQTAAIDLVARLNDLHSYSDDGKYKALTEWQKRKMDRAKQREFERGSHHTEKLIKLKNMTSSR